ncbi:MAG: hypothetical protein JXR89_09660, partial [Deltaproteobacteria bacterium]|nr:hypothetical protein [Deltaproteobacteria bacterium]
MIEQLKIAFIALSFFFGVFVFGVLVGLELPKTEFYQHWVDVGKSHLAQARPTQVAVMRMPGSGPAAASFGVETGSGKDGHEECPGGVCRLPTGSPAVAPLDEITAKPQERQLDLTFYSELSDKPTESGGATLMIKKRAQVGLEKKNSSALKESLAPPAPTVSGAPTVTAPVVSTTPAAPSGELWELRICSLPHE